MKDFFKKTTGKIVIIAAVGICVLAVFLVKNGQEARVAPAVTDEAAQEQMTQQARETAAAATQTPKAALGEGEAAQTERQSEPKEALPIFMEFGADWCPYCEQMKPTIEELKKEYEGKLQFVEVNIDDEPETAAAFGVRSVPYYVLVDAEGQPALAYPGATTKEKLQDFIKEGVGVEP